jgi:hypothetical protein
VVPHLVGARRGDQGDEAVDQLASLHQDVRRAVAPGGLEAQGQPAIGLLLEAIVRERRPRGVAAEPLETSAIAGGHGDLGVKVHAAVLGHTGRGVRIFAVPCRLHAVAEAPPAFARVRSVRDAGAQGSCGEQGEERLVSGEGFVIPVGAGLEQAVEPTSGTGEHARHFAAARWRHGEEARRRCVSHRVGVGAVESQGVEVGVQVQRRAEALEDGHGAALRS